MFTTLGSFMYSSKIGTRSGCRQFNAAKILSFGVMAVSLTVTVLFHPRFYAFDVRMQAQVLTADLCASSFPSNSTMTVEHEDEEENEGDLAAAKGRFGGLLEGVA